MNKHIVTGRDRGQFMCQTPDREMLLSPGAGGVSEEAVFGEK
jgi:hypothetical protein